MKILNCSRATVHNWIKQGRLRLNKTLENGYRDIEDVSVYEAVAATYEPSRPENVVVVFAKDGSRRVFWPSDSDAAKVAEYLKEKSRLERS